MNTWCWKVLGETRGSGSAGRFGPDTPVLTSVQALGDSSGVDQVALAQVTRDVRVEVPQLDPPGQHIRVLGAERVCGGTGWDRKAYHSPPSGVFWSYTHANKKLHLIYAYI